MRPSRSRARGLAAWPGGLRRVPEVRECLGASAPLPRVRPRGLLRRLAEPARHAALHATHHPVIRSLEPGEDWGWCYVDELFIEPAPRAGERESRGEPLHRSRPPP